MDVGSLRQHLVENEYDYDANVNYIEAIRSIGDIQELRNARESLHARYALTEAQWCAWIEDLNLEPNSTFTNSIKLKLALYEQAVMEHPVSTKLWFDYLQCLVINFRECQAFGDETLFSQKNLTKLFDRALEVVGWHGINGYIIWDLYREFLELTLEGDIYMKSVMDSFRQQLTMPHSELDKTYQKYLEFKEKCQNIDSRQHSIICSSYEKSKKAWMERMVYEEGLISSNMSWEAIGPYLEFEKKAKTNQKRSSVIALYERAIETYQFSLEAWLEYTIYVDTDVAIPFISVDLYRRATKCVPWSSLLWSGYLRSLERSQIDDLSSIIESTVQQAQKILLTMRSLSVYDFVTIQMAYLEYLYRNAITNEKDIPLFRVAIESTLKAESEQFPENGDTRCIIERFWATAEAAKFKNIEKTRQLYDHVILKKNSFESDIWLEYISLERHYGKKEKCLTLYKNACATHVDYPEKLFEHYLLFVREEGSLENYYDAYGRIYMRRKHIYALQQKQLQQSEDSKGNDTRSKADTEKKVKGSKKQEIPEHASADIDTGKRKPEIPGENPAAKRTKVEEPSIEEKARTVFVSNLDFSLKESQLETVFKQFGEVSRIDFIRDAVTQKFKGYAYVVLKDEVSGAKSSVATALENDRIPIEGRPAFISQLRQKDGHSVDKVVHRTGLAGETTVFISNLPKNVSEADIRSRFEKYGEIKGVQMMETKGGQFRGLAYIQFHSNEAALAALQEHEADWSGRKIHAVMSAVPFEKIATTHHEEPSPKVLQKLLLSNFKPRQITRAPRISLQTIPSSKDKDFCEKK